MGAQSLSGSVSAFCQSESETIQQSTMAESDQQIVDKVKAALDTAVGILNDREGWKVEKEAPSWHPSPPSSRCGSPSRSTMSLAHPSSTGSVSKKSAAPGDLSNSSTL